MHSVQKNFTFQTGDPIGPGSSDSDGGSSIWGLLRGPSHKTFTVELPPKLKHTERGTVSMATAPSSTDPDERLAGSQFIITLGDNLDYLDGKAAIFGKVVEGFDVLEKINESFIDDNGRPLKDIRIRHTVILDDPYDDPPGLNEPPESPVPSKAQLATVRIADDEELDENMDEEAMEKLRREREARAQALTLEMVGDLPFAEVKPPENVLFVCKLNPVTQGKSTPCYCIYSIYMCVCLTNVIVDEDLQLIFSRFGQILSCEVIRDKRTGDSLQYAFIEFENQKDCEQAYFKMEGVLIDDHRIHVDFSQSVCCSPRSSLTVYTEPLISRSPSSPTHGDKLRFPNGKAAASVVYRVLNESASTVLLTTVVVLTVTAWSLTKTRCGGVRTRTPNRHSLKGHAVAALDRDPTDAEMMTDIVMTDGAMTEMEGARGIGGPTTGGNKTDGADECTIRCWGVQCDVIIVKAMNQEKERVACLPLANWNSYIRASAESIISRY